MIPALASIFDICLSDNWPVHVWTPASPRNSLNPWECGCSTFFPQEEQVRRQAGARPCTGSSLQLCMGTISLNLVYKILTSTCTCTHLPLRLTNPLRVRKLHFPPLGEAGTRAGWYTTHMLVQINSGVRYLWVSFLYRLRIIQSIDRYMYARPPAPTPNQSLEGVEAPLSSHAPMGEAGAKAGRHTTLCQCNTVFSCLHLVTGQWPT